MLDLSSARGKLSNLFTILLITLGAACLLSAGWNAVQAQANASPITGGDQTPTPVPSNSIFLPLVSKNPLQISGRVVDTEGPVQGATVRVRAAENKTLSDEAGNFLLPDIGYSQPVSVTAWAQGYYVGWTSASAATNPVTITLKPHYTSDNPDYDWFSLEGQEGSISCSHCMPCYEEWQADAHASSAVNPRFVSMYNGTDLHGNQSPPTEYLCIPDYGCTPLPPDPNEPYYGPGYKLDFPESAGNCAACHAPAAAAIPGMEYSADINQLSGIELEGVFCEFCHKVGDVALDPDTELPFPNMPGVLSERLFRPEGDQQLFFGNFDDVTRRVSYLPLIEESAFCAPCHFGQFWDTVVYNSYGEWLESPYSQTPNGRTCQDCHMPPVDYDYFVYPEKGGLDRDRSRIFSHQMPGAMDQDLLQNALTMATTAWQESGKLNVEVILTNDKTGHHLPTGSPLRNMILLVEASDSAGNPLRQLSGPTVPAWGGIGDPQSGYYAGLPGQGYAKILEESWTGVSPSGAYWNQTRVINDNRLAALQSDVTSYTFEASDAAQVEVKLLFRRAFIELMDWKAWEAVDILMEQQILQVDP
jgi:nitrate/TMAO reductase-like tetraheme cytochrome c subunit